MKCLITYEEFSKLVPEHTKKFVDDFLQKTNIKYNYNNDHQKDTSNIMLMASYIYHFYEKEDSSIKMIFIENGFNFQTYDNKFCNTTTSSIDDLYEEKASYLCVCDDIHEYLYLTPERIFYENIKYLDINKYYFPDSFKDKFKSIFNSSNSINKETFKENMKKCEAEQYQRLIDDNFTNVSLEVKNYMERVAHIHALVSPEIINSDILEAILVLALYNDEETKNIVDYFEYFGITKDKVDSMIRNLKVVKNYSSTDINKQTNTPDLAIIIQYYNMYLKLKENVSELRVEDIIESLVANDTFVFDKILKNFEVNFQQVKNLSEKVSNYNEEKHIQKFQKLYSDFPIATVKYVEFISKIFKVLENEKLNTKYSENEMIGISILISIYYKNNDIESYLNNNEVTLDSILKYLNINKEDIEASIKEASDEHVGIVFLGLEKVLTNYSVDALMLHIFNNYNKHEFEITKIIKNINPSLKSENIMRDVKNHIEQKNSQERINKLKKFYGELPIDTIKFIEKSAIFYDILKYDDDNYSIEDKIELSILSAYTYGEKNNLSTYICEVFGKSSVQLYD